MKINFKLCLFLLGVCSVTAVADEKIPTDAERVAGIQKECAEAGEAIKQRQAEKALYDRLGKRPKIKNLVTELLAAHSKNEKIGHLFVHVKKGPFVKNVTDFLVAGTGGKANYRGKDMLAVHKHMKVSNADFLAAGGDFEAVMKKAKYGPNEIQEVICSLASFIPVVVVQQ